MSEEALVNLRAYAARHQFKLRRKLGNGIHGEVYSARGQGQLGVVALKANFFSGPYKRERDIYLRLRDEGVSQIRGHAVPQLIRFDDELQILEMTVVSPPFLLDFAGAYLDFPPEHSEEIWADRTASDAENFGPDWPTVQQILSDLEDLGIYMHDPTPANIRFR